jgi:hypothetical protein
MLPVKSNTFGTILNTQNMQETNIYLNNSDTCRLDNSFAAEQNCIFSIIQF